MKGIVEPETPDRADVRCSQRRQEQQDIGYLVRHLMLAKDVARHDPSLLGLVDVDHTLGANGVAI